MQQTITAMDVSQIIQLVSGVGFPAAMCLGMFYFIIKRDDRQVNTLTDNTKKLAELTTAIEELSAKLNNGQKV